MSDDESPQETSCTITDTQGRAYVVRISFYARVWYLKVRAGNSRVGYANCGVEEDAIHIDDIRIENEARQRESFAAPSASSRN